MQTYTIEKLSGQWKDAGNHAKIHIDGKGEFLLKNGRNLNGTIEIYENFIIFTDLESTNSWTGRIEKLSKNKLHLTDLSIEVGMQIKMKRAFFDLSLIHEFDFEINDSLTMEKIKQLFELTKIDFIPCKDIDGNEIPYYRHWNNDLRYLIMLKTELTKKVMLNKDILLNMTKSIKTGSLGFYTRFDITEHIDPESVKYYDSYDNNYANYNSGASRNECGACLESPCMCSDAEQTSTVFGW